MRTIRVCQFEDNEKLMNFEVLFNLFYNLKNYFQSLLVQVGVKECLIPTSCKIKDKIEKILQKCNIPLSIRKNSNNYYFIIKCFFYYNS